MTGYRLGGWGSVCDWGRDFSFCHHIQTGPVAYPASDLVQARGETM